jgi:hypothetical protein
VVSFGNGAVIIESGKRIEEINPIRALDEMIEQSDRYLE